jgi:high affinity cAMP-specific and IBMX-insensitive 3',5'-cyclic phosphodiesterase 8
LDYLVYRAKRAATIGLSPSQCARGGGGVAPHDGDEGDGDHGDGMGCTPSIHVSQTGVVYCRDSDESNSPHPSSLGATQVVHQTTVIAGPSQGQGSRQQPTGKASTISITEAETQTSRHTMKGANTEAYLGPIRLKQHTMSVLLVFGKEDAQSDSFWWAADKAGYKCNLVHTAEAALESFLDKHHDVIVIDHRSSKYYDAESLCRSIRATKSSEHTVVVAVTKKYSGDKEEPSILPLLNAGFNRRFMENANVSVCLNEMLLLEHGEVKSRIQLHAAHALLTVVESSTDAIELTNEHHQLQYVNPAYERLFGYTCDELLGQDVREVLQSDKNKPDLQDTMMANLKKAKPWEGLQYSKRKTGDSICHQCTITPVAGQSGKTRHFVSIKNTRVDPQYIDKYGNFDINQMANGVHGYKRRESMTRIHSMTIEAPITKVINIINTAQENSPGTVVAALDKVLEILRSSELYSPYFGQPVHENDQMTNDLVGGLMTTQQGLKRRFSADFNKGHQPVMPITSLSQQTLSQIPKDVQDILDLEETWDFDVIKLEKATKRRPLVHLGMKILQRFGVLEFLQVPETVMICWLQTIEANYQSANSYHNSSHAADVLHATAFFLGRDRLKNVFDQMDEVASLIAAIVHDLDHPGRTNSFLVNARSELSILYNDLAVLESHHASLAFQISQKDDRLNIFKNLDRDDYRAIRQQVIDMVLATEMTKHFEHLSKFVSSINKHNMPKTDDDVSSVVSRTTAGSMADLTTPENRVLIKRMLIKCADVSNPLRPLALCKTWATRIAEEYCQQTDEEKKQGLPVVMPVFDRKTCNVPKSQTSFVDFFVNDMFDAWDAFCDIPVPMTHLQSNYKYWKDQEEVAAAEVKRRLEEEEKQKTESET